MRLRLLFLFFMIAGWASLLMGCQHGPKVVKIPVPIMCNTPKPAEPDYPVVNNDDGLFVRTQKLLEKEKLQEAYIAKLSAWGESCNA